MDTDKDTTTNKLLDKARNEVRSSNGYVMYVSKKLEKLASALYLVTRHLPKDDPLRQSIRHKALTLLSRLYNSSVPGDGDASDLPLASTVQNLVSELRIAKNAGVISQMNSQVLEEEFNSLLQVLDGKGETMSQPQLTGADFSVDSLPENDVSSELRKKLRGISSETMEDGKDESRGSQAAQSDDNTSTPSGESTSSSRKNRGPKKRRRDIILNILKDKPEINVRDVTEVIPNYSAKTIQRDLKALVKEGVLVKEGKRRWTTYRLSEEADL